MPTQQFCDKCGGVVEKHNDVTYLEAIMERDISVVMNYKPRHVICDPSRARYIQHPDFSPYRPPIVDEVNIQRLINHRVESWTEAWVTLQMLCGLTLSTSLQ